MRQDEINVRTSAVRIDLRLDVKATPLDGSLSARDVLDSIVGLASGICHEGCQVHAVTVGFPISEVPTLNCDVVKTSSLNERTRSRPHASVLYMYTLLYIAT